MNKKFSVDENNMLFREFDAEASLLNGFKDGKTLKQNAIYYTTENKVDKQGELRNAEQIRDKLVYDDIMDFDQITPGAHFGGRVLPPFEIYMNLRRVYFGIDYLERPVGAPTEE